MSRFYRKIALLNFIIFTVVMLLIRAQPYDDHELRALLMPDDCEMPCFMGIRPGVTTVDEAVKLLQNNSWVGTIDQNREANYLSWTWNGQQPFFIDASQVGGLQSDATYTLVEGVNIQLTIPLGRTSLILGRLFGFKLQFLGGDLGTLNGKQGALYVATYHDYPIMINAWTFCPFPWVALWDSPSILFYRVRGAEAQPNSPEPLNENIWCR